MALSRRHLAGMVLSAMVAAGGFDGADAAPELRAMITDPALDEISGMAASRRHPGVFWVHNDSGDGPFLYAIDGHGEHVATLKLEGARSRDWEDIAAFTRAGRHWLLVADVGDNGGIRSELELVLVEEPERLANSRASVVRTLRFRWPDGARDCEAVAVDAEAGEILLLAKKRVPPELWRLKLDAPEGDLQVAERIGTLAGVTQPSEEDLRLNPVYGRYRSQVTAADLAPDGGTLAVLNYRTSYLYLRASGESWAQAITQEPQEREFSWIPQAEAIAFDLAGERLWISSEKLPAPLVSVEVAQPTPSSP